MAATMMSARCLPAAGAFARSTPAKQQPRAVRMRASDPTAPDPAVTPQSILDYAKTLPGVSQPFPNIFDPANLLANATSIQEVRRWRESEITHGRVAMLAALGFVVGEQVEDFPLFPHVVGPAINHFQQVEAKGAIFWEPLVFAIGLAEAYRVGLGWDFPKSETFNQLRDDYEMGNLGFDPLGLLPTDPKERYDMQTKELNNGRLAMIAIAAFVAQELVSKDEIFEHLFVNIEKDVVSGPNT
ncbi:hypothetical protein WJX81_003558 [Elliptochloris bilobata]|uniref:Chlorophyll a-b binding protein, chloroplastic n=1 Tax=Elliptochloris bilobata TaxID=381761 RepID=A0AAW1QDA5_9CHLO